MTARELAATVESYRFASLNEDALQAALHGLLGGGREVVLTAGGRVDLLVGGVAVEVKVAGSAEAVYRQVQRYSHSVEVAELLIVSTRSSHRDLPGTAGGKPLFFAIARGTI